MRPEIAASADSLDRDHSPTAEGTVKSDHTLIWKIPFLIPGILALLALPVFAAWLKFNSESLALRVPGTDHTRENEAGKLNPVLAGKVIHGPGQASTLPEAWTQF